MADPEKPNDQWREQMAAAANQLSGLWAEASRAALESVRDSVAALQKALQVSVSHDLLAQLAERQAAFAAGIQSILRTPDYQELLFQVASVQTDALQKALQTPEYQTLLNQMAESQRAACQALAAQIGPAFAEWQSNALQDTWNRFRDVIAEGIERTHDALERVDLLAVLGWTLPMEMSLPEFHVLVMQDGLTADAVEEWFLDYYSRDDGAEFKSLKARLLTSAHLVFWKPLLEQVFVAFERGDFALCVPSLLLVLEGSIAVPWKVTFQKRKARETFFQRQVEAALKDSIDQYLWKSVAAFVNIVFEEKVSPRREYPIPKRNLILHGKSDPAKWDRADGLRLFQAIDTILSLGDKLPIKNLKAQEAASE